MAEKRPFSVSAHCQKSSPSCCGLWPLNKAESCSKEARFREEIVRLHYRFQSQDWLFHALIFDIFAVFLLERRNKRGNMNFRVSPPTQTSSQKEVLFPLPNFLSKEHPRPFPLFPQKREQRSFHQFETLALPFPCNARSLESSNLPYMECRTLAHSLSGSIRILHAYLLTNALLKYSKSRIPRPPSHFGLQISVHPTQGIF